MADTCAFGFILVQEREFGERSTSGFIGAYMATNERGHPLEFRISTPVKPSAVQRAIYGSDLRSYVSADLIAKTLRSDAEQAVDAVLIGQDAEMFADTKGVPVIRIFTGETPSIGAPSLVEGAVRTSGRALFFETRAEHRDRAHELLELACTGFDPSAAFGRMGAAISVLLAEDERFR